MLLFAFRMGSMVYMASGEAKYASRALGWVLPSAGEVGTSAAVLVNSNVHAVVLRGFPSAFTTTKIVP